MKIFGSLESHIMPILWRDGQTTVKQVHRELIDCDIAYPTLRTTMERLAEKGVLNRHREGLAYIYTLARSREDCALLAVRQIVDEVLDGDARSLVRALR